MGSAHGWRPYCPGNRYYMGVWQSKKDLEKNHLTLDRSTGCRMANR